MVSNTTYKKKKKEKRKKAARNKRRINAVDTHDFTLGPVDEKEKKAFKNLYFFLFYHVGNAKRNKANPFVLFL
jgi:hypothetical protein